MRLNIFNSLMGLCVATAAVSCSDVLVDDVDMRPVGSEDSDMISFVVADKNNTTRGGSYGNRLCGGVFLHSSNGADSLYLNMSVADIDELTTRGDEISRTSLPTSLYMYCRISTKEGKSYYFDDTLFEKDDAGSVWASNPPYYWLNNETHYKFFGYFAPKDKKATWVKNGEKLGKDRIPTIDFTTPDDVRKHFDLSYSIDPFDNELSDVNGEYIATQKVLVPVSMKHSLSKIILETGSEMADGEITSVTIKGVCDKGNLNLGNGEWELEKVEGSDDHTTNGVFTLSDIKVSGQKQPITDTNSFFVLPQKNTEGAEIEIEFTPKGQSKPDTYVASLAGIEWEAGKQYTYIITITPEANMYIDLVPDTVDAHYVIAKAHVKVDKLPEGKQWELTVSANDGANVTLVNNLNKHNKNGYWTDKIVTRKYDKDGNLLETTEDSARGSSSISGDDDQFVYIFLPENVGDGPRSISLKLKIQGSESIVSEETFNQNCPIWSGGSYGWESSEEYTEWVDDGNGSFMQKEGKPAAPWGFNWTRKISYQAQTTVGNMWVNSQVIKDLVNQYNASNYTTVTNTGFLELVKIDINYNDIGKFDGITFFDADGLKNSHNLYNNIGLTSTNINGLESALLALNGYAISWSAGITTIQLMKPVKGSESGTINEDPVALGYVLKKNRFIIEKSIRQNEVNNKIENVETEDVSFENGTKDIVWYMPAKNQFESFERKEGADDLDGIYWSSNPDGDHEAFTNSSPNERTISNKIRACRTKPKIY